MTTELVVADDVLLATYWRRQHELSRRILQGTFDLNKVNAGIQAIIETCGKVANINLACAYENMGMGATYREESKKFDLFENSDSWKVLVFDSLTFAQIGEGYKASRLKLETYGVNLDDVIDLEKELRTGTYLASFPRAVESPAENGGQKARQRRDAKHKDITLKAHLVMGLAYFLETGELLDRKRWTQCQGSRHRDGLVPCVHSHLDGQTVRVGWDSPDYADPHLCARSEFPSS